MHPSALAAYVWRAELCAERERGESAYLIGYWLAPESVNSLTAGTRVTHSLGRRWTSAMRRWAKDQSEISQPPDQLKGIAARFPFAKSRRAVRNNCRRTLGLWVRHTLLGFCLLLWLTCGATPRPKCYCRHPVPSTVKELRCIQTHASAKVHFHFDTISRVCRNLIKWWCWTLIKAWDWFGIVPKPFDNSGIFLLGLNMCQLKIYDYK